MNPFSDSDRHDIWEMLVARDIDAFLACDWNLVANDFLAEEFFGVDGRKSENPDTWRLTYPTLGSYQREWILQANDFHATQGEENPSAALHALTVLCDIEIRGDRAMVHKKFDGPLKMKGGTVAHFCWQTLYHCRKIRNEWKICGFTGYLPNPMGGATESSALPATKRLPAGASQHRTAGPYSPVLEITPGKLVVISGQASLDREGNVVGESIEEQARQTMENCFAQLASAGCLATDVFKVNIFMADLSEWPRLNLVYQEMMPEPRPVRTAVQVGLLPALKVEIEMWAVRP